MQGQEEPYATTNCVCREGRDPRFAATARRSDADTEVAAKRYAFLYTDVLPKEKAALKAALKVSVCLSLCLSIKHVDHPDAPHQVRRASRCAALQHILRAMVQLFDALAQWFIHQAKQDIISDWLLRLSIRC